MSTMGLALASGDARTGNGVRVWSGRTRILLGMGTVTIAVDLLTWLPVTDNAQSVYELLR